jgi:hypothetical protein
MSLLGRLASLCLIGIGIGWLIIVVPQLLESSSRANPPAKTQ